MNGLTVLVKDDLHADPHASVVYVFRAERSDRVKILWWDGSGVVGRDGALCQAARAGCHSAGLGSATIKEPFRVTSPAL